MCCNVHGAIALDVAGFEIVLVGAEIEPQVSLRSRRFCQTPNLFGFDPGSGQARQYERLVCRTVNILDGAIEPEASGHFSSIGGKTRLQSRIIRTEYGIC